MRTPLALLSVSLGIVAAVWWWLAAPVTLARAPIDPAAKLECVSYAPFRGDQTPHNPDLIVSPDQIAEDLAVLAGITKCIRTYSIDNGLDKVPELASKVGLKVLLGVWLGRTRATNAILADKAISLARDHSGTVSAIIVGSEVLLRGDMIVSDLREIIRSVKQRANVPVTYADVWEFWLRHKEVAADVDFVTVHFLPYWEDVPVRAEEAAAHVDQVRLQVVAAFPGKEILIGETGWPSHGRMRDGALASRINQARFISDILGRAARDKFRVNLFEAYDEPWKRKWEGSVGAHWGSLDATDRKLKYPAGAEISNYPSWKLQLACGLAFCISVFGAGLLTLRLRPSPPPRASAWVAVAICATTGGVLLGIGVEKMLLESYGIGGWLLQGSLIAAGMAAPLLSAHALVAGRSLPTFFAVLSPADDRGPSPMTRSLGITLILTTLLATETALALVFDGRWRDFPFASLTMAVMPFFAVAMFNSAESGRRPLAECVFAGLFAVTAPYIALNEGAQNWQSLWTCAAYLVLGITLWRPRAVTFAETAADAVPAVVMEPAARG
ncbi:glycosyl hydrolase family 17 protein [Bradyrhizobium sp.]|uniref:glycoside hydrolase family 17 protein n=1 Tax=Bradyrhizobium sp. TaxID=376 RepID=UPI0034189600